MSTYRSLPIKTNDRISEVVNTAETGGETHGLTGHELGDVHSAGGSLSSPVTREEVVRQTEAATDPLTNQLQRLCDLMIELQQTFQ